MKADRLAKKSLPSVDRHWDLGKVVQFEIQFECRGARIQEMYYWEKMRKSMESSHFVLH